MSRRLALLMVLCCMKIYGMQPHDKPRNSEVDQHDKQGLTQLMVATQNNDIDKVKELLAAGASINKYSQCPNCKYVKIPYEGPPSMPGRSTFERQCNAHFQQVSAFEIAQNSGNHEIIKLLHEHQKK